MPRGSDARCPGRRSGGHDGRGPTSGADGIDQCRRHHGSGHADRERRRSAGCRRRRELCHPGFRRICGAEGSAPSLPECGRPAANPLSRGRHPRPCQCEVRRHRPAARWRSRHGEDRGELGRGTRRQPGHLLSPLERPRQGRALPPQRRAAQLPAEGRHRVLRIGHHRQRGRQGPPARHPGHERPPPDATLPLPSPAGSCLGEDPFHPFRAAHRRAPRRRAPHCRRAHLYRRHSLPATSRRRARRLRTVADAHRDDDCTSARTMLRVCEPTTVAPTATASPSPRYKNPLLRHWKNCIVAVRASFSLPACAPSPTLATTTAARRQRRCCPCRSRRPSQPPATRDRVLAASASPAVTRACRSRRRSRQLGERRPGVSPSSIVATVDPICERSRERWRARKETPSPDSERSP